jgi:hypothetical protein
VEREPPISYPSGSPPFEGGRPGWIAEPLISVEQLADHLGRPKQTISDWRVSGKAPTAYRIGKQVRVAVSDVRA